MFVVVRFLISKFCHKNNCSYWHPDDDVDDDDDDDDLVGDAGGDGSSGVEDQPDRDPHHNLPGNHQQQGTTRPDRYGRVILVPCKKWLVQCTRVQ